MQKAVHDIYYHHLVHCVATSLIYNKLEIMVIRTGGGDESNFGNHNICSILGVDN